MNKWGIKNRLKYWLDKRMSKGTISLIKVMVFIVLFVVVGVVKMAQPEGQ